MPALIRAGMQKGRGIHDARRRQPHSATSSDFRYRSIPECPSRFFLFNAVSMPAITLLRLQQRVCSGFPPHSVRQNGNHSPAQVGKYTPTPAENQGPYFSPGFSTAGTVFGAGKSEGKAGRGTPFHVHPYARSSNPRSMR